MNFLWGCICDCVFHRWAFRFIKPDCIGYHQYLYTRYLFLPDCTEIWFRCLRKISLSEVSVLLTQFAFTNACSGVIQFKSCIPVYRFKNYWGGYIKLVHVNCGIIPILLAKFRRNKKAKPMKHIWEINITHTLSIQENLSLIPAGRNETINHRTGPREWKGWGPLP